MLSIEKINYITVFVSTVAILICSISIVISIKFQKKQKVKYQECLRLIHEKENGTLNVCDGISEEELKKFDSKIDINKLMMNLYDIYLEFINKLNNNNKDFENILDSFIKEFYENKIDIYKNKGCLEIIDSIDLINYSIIEFNKEKLKFRININCLNYKVINENVISGSKYEKVEQILILTYIKSKKNWLINNIEKVYEKKMSI